MSLHVYKEYKEIYRHIQHAKHAIFRMLYMPVYKEYKETEEKGKYGYVCACYVGLKEHPKSTCLLVTHICRQLYSSFTFTDQEPRRILCPFQPE